MLCNVFFITVLTVFFFSGSRREASLMPNPVSLESTFNTTTSSHFPVMKENISPARVLSSMESTPSLRQAPLSSFPTTPISKHLESDLTQPSPADYRFSVGPLPNWAKAKVREAARSI